ncbi:MAG: PAS domain S-box protein, partial [Desulfonatronospira sp. MSAO_Bac3]
MHQTEFICRFLPDGTHLFVNEAYCRRFNKTEEELIGTRFKPVIHPDDREKVTRLFAQLTPDHPTGKIDQRIILQDHDIVWDRWITRAFFNDDGTVREYQSVGRDITDRKEVEETLRAQQHLLEGVLDNISDVLAIQHPDHSIERYNKAGYDLLGMTPEEVKGKKCYEIIGRDRECEPCATTRAVQSGQKEQLEKFVPELGLFLDCRSNPIVDEEGNVILIIEQLRDITRQKIAEEQLRISEGRFRNVIELLPLAAAIIDPDGNYTFINNRFTEMFGYTLEDISAGKDWFTLAYPDPSYREEVIAAWKADRSALGPGTARPRKFWVRCRNGDTKLIFFQPVELCEGSEFILYEDITEDRQVYDLLIKEID